MFVCNKMSRNLYSIDESEKLPAAKRMMDARHVSHLPVVKGGKLVGVLSAGDLGRAMPSVATTLSATEIPYLLEKISVADIMSRNPVTTTPKALLEDAAKIMRDFCVSFLPVLDNGKLVGVISDGDIFDAFIELQGARESGWRLVFETTNHHGVLAKITSCVETCNGNITVTAVYRHEDPEKRYIILGVSEDTEIVQLEAKLKENGLAPTYKNHIE